MLTLPTVTRMKSPSAKRLGRRLPVWLRLFTAASHGCLFGALTYSILTLINR
jgi:hypothetical protein